MLEAGTAELESARVLRRAPVAENRKRVVHSRGEMLAFLTLCPGF